MMAFHVIAFRDVIRPLFLAMEGPQEEPLHPASTVMS